MTEPRVISLKQAKAYLHGLDPRAIGVAPITGHPLRFDRKVIDRKLDAMDPAPDRAKAEANDNEDSEVQGELDALKAKISGTARP